MIDLTNLSVSLSITGFLTYLKYRSDSKKKLMSSYQSYLLYSTFILTVSYGLLYYFQQHQENYEMPRVDSSSSLTETVEELVETIEEPVKNMVEQLTEQANTILDVNPNLPSWN